MSGNTIKVAPASAGGQEHGCGLSAGRKTQTFHDLSGRVRSSQTSSAFCLSTRVLRDRYRTKFTKGLLPELGRSA
jgi:hypothetical protein